MKHAIFLAALCVLASACPGLLQAQDTAPVMRGGEIIIPTERTLEREAVTQPRNEFSTNDAISTGQMDRQNRRIDREVEKGIGTGC